jgi:hypothetical protein
MSGKAHALYSASSSERWRNCPGSIALSLLSPKEEESPYAAEGTTAHECHEKMLGECIHDADGATICFSPNNDKIRRKYVEEYGSEIVDNVVTSIEWIIEERAWKIPEEHRNILVEIKVDASPYTCEGQFGTLDCAVYEEFGLLTIVDFKYGAGHAVDPEGEDGKGNSQLVYYALGIAHELEFNFSEVELVVIQPRAYSPDGEAVKIFRMSVSELMAWIPVFQKAVKRCEKAKLVLLSGRQKRFQEKYLKAGKWCQFCPAAAFCPEVSTNALDRVGMNEDFSVPEFEALNPLDIGRMLSAAENIDFWLRRLKGHAFSRLIRGEDVDGYKLCEKRPTTSWLKGVENVLEDEGLDTVGMKKVMASPAQFKKAVKTLVGKKRKRAEIFLERFTERKSSGLTMTKEEDVRPSRARAEDYFT